VGEVIAYLRGTARSPRILDVDGVGYLLSCVTPMIVGEEVELLVHTQVREDAITLYGFTSEDEKVLFEALIKVTGVGPANAMTLLGGLGPNALVDAIRRRDIKTITSVKGVGAKLAEKIVTLVSLPAGLNEDGRVTELVKALTGLGYERARATDAATRALEESATGADEAGVLTAAIALAQRSGR